MKNKEIVVRKNDWVLTYLAEMGQNRTVEVFPTYEGAAARLKQVLYGQGILNTNWAITRGAMYLDMW